MKHSPLRFVQVGGDDDDGGGGGGSFVFLFCMELALFWLYADRWGLLQESASVSVMREKIKHFLASQGMIKGHSGSGPRSPEREPITLRLVEEFSGSDSSTNSPSPELSDDSHVLTMSNIRDEPSWHQLQQPQLGM